MKYKVKVSKTMTIHAESEDSAYEMALMRINEDGFEPDEAEVTEMKEQKLCKENGQKQKVVNLKG